MPAAGQGIPSGLLRFRVKPYVVRGGYSPRTPCNDVVFCKETMKQLPDLPSLRATTEPPILLIASFTSASPNPLPPAGVVVFEDVVNASKTLSSSFVGIPNPESLT